MTILGSLREDNITDYYLVTCFIQLLWLCFEFD